MTFTLTSDTVTEQEIKLLLGSNNYDKTLKSISIIMQILNKNYNSVDYTLDFNGLHLFIY